MTGVAPTGITAPDLLRLGGWQAPAPTPSQAEWLALAAAHAELTPIQRASLTAHVQLATTDEWREALTVALERGLVGLLWRHLAWQRLTPRVPAPYDDRLRDAYRGGLLHSMRLEQALTETLAVCQAADIPVIPRKGPILARRLYGALDQRPSRDLDLFMHPRVTQRRAYVALAPIYARWEPRGVRIELTWDLIRHPPHHAAFPSRAIWARATATTYRGVPCHQLAPGDELRYLCAHYVKHGMQRWLWLADIAELTQRLDAAPGWSWEDFAAATIAAGLALPVLMTWRQAQSLLELPLPENASAPLTDAAASSLEQRRWRWITQFWQRRDHPWLMLRAATWREKLATLALTAWPSRAYLYDASDWRPGESVNAARMRRLGQYLRRG